jgi:hypothetical protein
MRVHRNLHKACWSLTVRGERVRHVGAFALAGVRFVVSAAGRARVLAKKVRAVHAWADGAEAAAPADLTGFVRVSYNPFRAGTFTTADGAPVRGAELVAFTADGKCMARGLTA